MSRYNPSSTNETPDLHENEIHRLDGRRESLDLGKFHYTVDSLHEKIPIWGAAARGAAGKLGDGARAFTRFVSQRRGSRSAFSWRERDVRALTSTAFRRLPLGALVGIVAVIAVAFAFIAASQTAMLDGLHLPKPSVQDVGSNGQLVLRQSADAVPTPTTSPYLIGIWTSTTNPGSAGSVRVYVRVTQGVQPVKRVGVYLSASDGSHYGPYLTDDYGLATFTANYSGLGNSGSIQYTATVPISGKTYTAEVNLSR